MINSTLKHSEANQPKSLESWMEQKVKLKEKIAKLTDNNILFFDNKKEQIITNLQTKLGITKEEIEKLLKEI